MFSAVAAITHLMMDQPLLQISLGHVVRSNVVLHERVVGEGPVTMEMLLILWYVSQVP